MEEPRPPLARCRMASMKSWVGGRAFGLSAANEFCADEAEAGSTKWRMHDSGTLHRSCRSNIQAAVVS